MKITTLSHSPSKYRFCFILLVAQMYWFHPVLANTFSSTKSVNMLKCNDLSLSDFSAEIHKTNDNNSNECSISNRSIHSFKCYRFGHIVVMLDIYLYNLSLVALSFVFAVFMSLIHCSLHISTAFWLLQSACLSQCNKHSHTHTIIRK